MDVFNRQTSTPFLQKITSNNIQFVKVPPNLTHIYQPLDVTVNCAAKQFIKRKFVDWHVGQIVTEKKKGTNVEEIDVHMKLPVMKPLHTSWLIELLDVRYARKDGKIVEL